MKSFLLTLSLICMAIYSYAQQGTLSGKVKDKKTGEAIIGATVMASSTKAAATDMDGSYSLKLAPGTYTITVSYVSYKTQTLNNIKIEEGKTTTLNPILEDDSRSLGEVTVVAQRQTNSDMSLIKEIKQSQVVVSGVSAEQITKSLDRDAAETVKRIPGVTVMGDRYILVRGLSERYNTVMLNDALTPSTEVDTKVFSFDLIPTSVIDRILIYKSGSPELPGEWGGGVIKVFTKSVATENITDLSVSTSFRGNTTFKDFRRYNGGSTDFLGFDNGTRKLPGNFPSVVNNSNSIAAGRMLQDNWTTRNSTAAPDVRVTLGLARKFDVGTVNLSNITAIGYTNTRQFFNIERYRYERYYEDTQRSDTTFRYSDNQYNENIRIGVIHNWTAQINNNNKIEFHNLFNQIGSSQTVLRSGTFIANGFDEQNSALRYESRSIYSGQLQGTHYLNQEKTQFSWITGYSYTNRNEPDYRRIRTQRPRGTEEQFNIIIPQRAAITDAGRYFSKLNENTYMARADVEHTLGQDTAAASALKVRAGVYTEYKKRNQTARWFSFVPTVGFDNSLLNQPLETIFSEENIRPGGFELSEGTSSYDSYDASNLLIAGYAGATYPIGAKTILSGGVRVEHNRQQLNSFQYTGEPVNADNPILSVLPSLNLSYNFNNRSLVRAAYSMSVNRPEFRELAPFTYNDFNFDIEIKGNPDLKIATIQHAEARYEFYPNPTELISVGVFYKYFKNPIENKILATSSGRTFTFTNADHSSSLGAEIELRKSLLDLTNSSFLQNISVVMNASVIKSQVTLSAEDADTQDANRAMMGQSPYIVNTGFYYQNDKKGLQVNLLYNIIGRRIFAVGNYSTPTIYEMPRNVVDLTFTKNIGERLQIKGGIQDILNQRTRMTQDSNRNDKIDENDDDILSTRRGSYSTIGLTYRF